MAQWLRHMLFHHVVADHRAACESPVLVIGRVGFDADEEQALHDVVAVARLGGVRWKLGTFAQADAWLVNGARTRVLADATLSVGGTALQREEIRFSLPDVDRPIAFAEPLPADFEPAMHFALDSPGSIHAVLGRFVLWLRPLAARLCLASQLIALHGELNSKGVYHVSCAGRLIAVVDLCGDCGVLPTATIGDFNGAEWNLRPDAARGLPAGFELATRSMLMWEYALRTGRDLLPPRYRQGAIYYRRPPRLPHRLLGDVHLLLLRELAFGSRNFDFLQRRTGMDPDELARHLAALYLVGSVTSTPARARVRPPRRTEPLRVWRPELAPHSDWPSRPASESSGSAPLDHTAPAPATAAA